MNEGRVLAGKYRLLSKLTAGGMGSVWRAEHVELGTPAAVKLLEPTIADSAEALARFKREAQSSASLRSSNIVQVFDFGVDGHTPYIAMELLRGRALSELLRERKKLSPRETSMILAQVARAAAWAHSQGIVHRDLKPGNIFLSEDANDIVVKLLDFGIAKPINIDFTVTPVTLAGSIMGTPQYMSPEQASGKREVDHRTDIWSFAVIAFECLIGSHAFKADTLGGLVLAICTEPMPVPSDFGPVPEGFDDWFARATERDPDERFQDIAEAGEALLSVCGVDPNSSHGLHLALGEREMHTIATPFTPHLRLTDSLLRESSTTLSRTFVTSRRKLFIFVGLFGTGAAAAAILQIAGVRSQQASRVPSAPVPTTTQGNVTASPNASALETQTVQSVSPQPASGGIIEIGRGMGASTATASGKRRHPSYDQKHASSIVALSPFARPLSPQSPTLAASASLPQAPAPAEPASTCDPGVKKKLGFCPRPGK